MKIDQNVWGIHGGRTGDAERLFEKQNVMALGWDKMGDLSGLSNRDDFKKYYEKVYPEVRPGSIPVSAGQLFRFVREIKKGDYVIYPSKAKAEIWIGEIVGDYEYNPRFESSYPNLRKVKWLNKYPRTKFSQGALYEIGSAMSLFQVKNYADEFLGALSQQTGELFTEQDEEEAVALVTEDIEQQSRDFVLKQISQKLKGHGLAGLVAHLLNLMGYQTKVSPPGPDRGVDITAHRDDLGVEPPFLTVQVKSSEGEANEAMVSQLYGKVADSKDFALFVSYGGFNKHALSFASGKKNLRLIEGDGLVDLIYKYYDKLDGKYKAVVPLKKVYIPEALSS